MDFGYPSNLGLRVKIEWGEDLLERRELALPDAGFRVQGFGFMVWGLWFRGWG